MRSRLSSCSISSCTSTVIGTCTPQTCQCCRCVITHSLTPPLTLITAHYSLTHSLTPPPPPPPPHTLITAHSLTHPPLTLITAHYSLTHPPTHTHHYSLTHSPPHTHSSLLTHSLIHPHPHTLITIHSLTHSPTQLRLYQLSRLLHDVLPTLHSHLTGHEITPFYYAAPWFLTLFSSQFPIAFVARVMGRYCVYILVELPQCISVE